MSVSHCSPPSLSSKEANCLFWLCDFSAFSHSAFCHYYVLSCQRKRLPNDSNVCVDVHICSPDNGGSNGPWTSRWGLEKNPSVPVISIDGWVHILDTSQGCRRATRGSNPSRSDPHLWTVEIEFQCVWTVGEPSQSQGGHARLHWLRGFLSNRHRSCGQGWQPQKKQETS